MKEIKLSKMHLVNWRGAKDRYADFGDCTETDITGDNGTGKSTFFDAFIWLLYGKDQFGRKDFQITPIVNHKTMNRVDSAVTAELVVDGELVTLNRTYHPKWVRHAGDKEESFDGYETRYTIDDVPCRQKDYNAKVENIIDGTIFHMISDPLFFLHMKWKDQRDVLFAITGTVKDADLAAKDPNFAALLDRVSGKTMDEYRKKVAAEKKKLTEALKAIPAKIDQTRVLMPDTPIEGWDKLEQYKADVEKKIENADQEIADAVQANKDVYNNQRELLNRVNELKKQRDDIIRDFESKAMKAVRDYNAAQVDEVHKANADRDAWIRELGIKQGSLKGIENDIQRLNNVRDGKTETVKRVQEEKDTLIAKWKETKAREFKAQTDCLICPIFAGKVCKDPDAAGRVEELNEKARQAFEAKKAQDIADINVVGKEKAAYIAALKKEIQDAEDMIVKNTEKQSELTAEIDELNKKIANTAEVVAKQKTYVPTDTEKIPGVADLNKMIQDAEAKANAVTGNIDTSDLQRQKADLMKEHEYVVKVLADRDVINRGNKAIEDLEEMSKKISQQIADIEKEEFLIADFVREKITECEKRINAKFRYVDWQLFDYTLDGGEVEVCRPLNKSNGTPLDVTNTADLLNGGLDIVNTLSEFYGVSAPIFIDRRESVTRLIDTKAQIINLVVAPGQDLSITNK